MILLRQDTRLEKQKLEQLLNRYGHVEYTFNTHAIQDDIDKVNEWAKDSYTTLRMENLKKVKVYLEGLLKKAQKGSFNVDWVLSGNKIVSMPVEIRRLKLYNIQATDYINLDKESILALDYTELLNIISYEISHRDFDMSTEEIEEKLEDIGIITVYDSQILKDIIDKRAYDKSLVMRVGETAYMSPNHKQIYTYFGDKLDFDGMYRKVIEESCATAISIIVNNILNKVSTNGYNIKICGIFEDSIYLMLPDGRNTVVESDLAAPVTIRAFGRKFEVKPKVQVY